jgi:hypothetical protein
MVMKKLSFILIAGLSINSISAGEAAEKVRQSIELFEEPHEYATKEDRTGHKITYSMGDKTCTRTFWPIAPLPVAAARQPSTICSHGLHHSTWDAMYKLWREQEENE